MNSDIYHIQTDKLSPRELEVMKWTAEGKTCAEISVLLSVSQETVRAHVKRACHKLKAKNKTHATAIAVGQGLISLDVSPKRGIQKIESTCYQGKAGGSSDKLKRRKYTHDK